MEETQIDFNDEILAEFLEESIEQISEMQNLLLEFEQDPTKDDSVDSIFRIAHSIKGSAGFFKLYHIQKLSHSLENVLDLLRKHELQPNGNIISGLIEGFEELITMCGRVKSGGNEIADETFFESLHQRLETLTRQSRSASEEILLFTLAMEAFESRLPSEVLTADYYKSFKSEYARLKNLVNVEPKDESQPEKSEEKKENAFRKTGDYFYQGVDVSNEMSAINDILKMRFDQSLPINTAQRFKDALKTLTRKLDGEAFRVADKMFLPIELVLASEVPFDQMVQTALADHFDRLMEFIEIPELDDRLLGNQDDTSGDAKDGKKTTRQDKHEIKTMRVSEEKVDGFIHFVGELVVIGDMFNYLELQLQQAAIPESTLSRFRQINQTFSTLSNNLRESLMEIRRIPVEGLLKKIPALARATADKVNKKVKVVLEGGELQIDKSIYELLDHPITHIIRNCVDHGLEAPAKRLELGKEEFGQIHVSMAEEEDWMILSIQDDGNGIDPQKIRNKAVEKGLMKEDQLARMDEQDLVNLIFLPGLSTATEVSDVSGRGVGLDVVKSNIEAVNGRITLDSTMGQGTRFEIKLPSSTSFVVIDGINTLVGHTEFIFPIEQMVSAFKPTTEDLYMVGNKEMVKHNDMSMPILRMHRLFELKTSMVDPLECTLVVADIRGSRFAVMVDALLGGTQVVIRDLGIKSWYKMDCHRGILGGSITGSGSIALVLDIPGLYKRMLGNA